MHRACLSPFQPAKALILAGALLSAGFLTPKAEAQSASPSPSIAASTPGWFPFTISSLEDGPALLDLSFLNEAETPAGKHGYKRAKGEVLTDDRGTPWRYFGVNLVAEACFPTEEQAVKLAGHFAKCGINLVRFHFLDENWSGVQLVRKDGQPGLEPGPLARLDFLFAELKKHGIYTNLNLHVGRKYPDQPAGAPDMSKGIDNIYPPYVTALKQYAKDLLTHVNPHTGLAYRDDPAVAIVEVNNENTLLFNAWWPRKVSGPVHESVKQQWTAWVARKYGNDEAALRAKWGTAMDGNGPNLVKNGAFTRNAEGWYLDNQGGAESTLAPAEGGKGIRITATRAGSEVWHTQLSQAAVPVENGKMYRLSFRARASGSFKTYISLQNAVSPFAPAGLWTLVPLEKEWQPYAYVFSGKDAVPGKVNLFIGTLQNVGWFEYADLKLEDYTDGYLPAEATLATGLPLPDDTARAAVQRDYFDFLAGTELAYTKEMHRYLKEDLKVKCLVAHSHIFFGALLGVRREGLASDVVHANAYWHHPSFPAGQWDPQNWETNQEVLSQDKVGGVLTELAVQRVEGKPFAITEWDIPAPIDSLAEGLPLLSAFASYQRWSGLTLFAWAHGTEDFTSDRYHSYFNYQGHPAKRAGIPFAALLFRTGAVAPGRERATLQVSLPTLLDDAAAHPTGLWSNWRRFYEKAGQDGSLALKRQTAVRLSENVAQGGGEAGITNAAKVTAPAVTDDGQITWGSATKVATVISQKAVFATGALGAKSLDLGPCTLIAAPLDGDGFGVWGAISLDGQPLESSKKILCMALRRSENEGMGWRADRRSVGNQWGKGPSLVLGYEAKVFLPGGEKANWKVSALGPDGNPTKVISEKGNEFPITPEMGTVWWVAERVE